MNSIVLELQREALDPNVKGSQLEVSLPGNLGIRISRGVNGDQPAKLYVSTAQFDKILENVKTIVLNWSLKLEANGIFGDGHSFTFSKEEKQAASTTSYNVNNFYGSASQLQIQQGVNSGSQKGSFTSETSDALRAFINESRRRLAELPLDSADRGEAGAELSTLEAQLSSSRPKANVIGQSLKTMRNILEGATGSLVAYELLQRIPPSSSYDRSRIGQSRKKGG